jgi:hypothetical protein
MSGITYGADAWGDLQSIFSTAQTAGADGSYTVDRTSDTATGDAINGSTPINNDAPSGWGGFWRDTLGAVVGYAIAKDASRNAVPQPGQTVPAGAAAASSAAPSSSSPVPGWLIPLAIGGAVVVAVIAFRKG